MKGAVGGASRGAGPDTASQLPGPKEVTCDIRGATSEPAMCAVLAVSILDLRSPTDSFAPGDDLR